MPWLYLNVLLSLVIRLLYFLSRGGVLNQYLWSFAYYFKHLRFFCYSICMLRPEVEHHLSIIMVVASLWSLHLQLPLHHILTYNISNILLHTPQFTTLVF